MPSAFGPRSEVYLSIKFSCNASSSVITIISHIYRRITDVFDMITANQLRAARSLAGLDQRKLAELSGLSLPTIQRMETSEDLIRGNVDSLTKLITALDSIGIEFIGDGIISPAGGRGVRLKESTIRSSDSWLLAKEGHGVQAKNSSATSRKSAETDEAADDAPSDRVGR